jgi:hypothetical protein
MSPRRAGQATADSVVAFSFRTNASGDSIPRALSVNSRAGKTGAATRILMDFSGSPYIKNRPKLPFTPRAPSLALQMCGIARCTFCDTLHDRSMAAKK